MASKKIDFRIDSIQKEILQDIVKSKNLSMRDFIMHSLYLQLEKDGYLLNFLNGEKILFNDINER